MGNFRWRVGDPVRVWTSNAISPDPFELTVAAIEHERVWIRAPGVPLKVGDRVLLERWPADDTCCVHSPRFHSDRLGRLLKLLWPIT